MSDKEKTVLLFPQLCIVHCALCIKQVPLLSTAWRLTEGVRTRLTPFVPFGQKGDNEERGRTASAATSALLSE